MDFVKMHGAGNDFLVIDGRDTERDWPALARQVCDRHFGVGGDGIIVVARSLVAPLRMRMFNPDGSEAEMCGNGIRCFVKYVVERSIVPGIQPLRVETGAGVLDLTYETSGERVTRVQVSMGVPRLAPQAIPVRVEGPGPLVDLPLRVGEHELLVTCVSLGNPHAVAFLSTPVEDFALDVVGPLVEHHALFPMRTNFEIARVVDPGHVEARVWERGAGLTLACGTGAAAVAVASRLHGLTSDRIEVRLPGGTLDLEWDGVGPVQLAGPAAEVFTGVWPEP